MREGIHPEYHQANVTCTCGNQFVVGSTRKEIKLDICSACHPFFTGKQKFVDTAGRVDKFFRKYSDEAQSKYQKKKKKRRRLSDEEVAAQEQNSALDAPLDGEDAAAGPDEAAPGQDA